MEIKKIHWPSCFWFFMAALSAVDFASSVHLSALILVLGFLCMGYSSIRLVPADQFTKWFPFFTTGDIRGAYRRVDIVTQFVGLVLIVSSLFISYASDT